mmetsp:Transcript_126/g.331  ORF Transcript_126/g.331 Transcript_126/m.331 type:complete len:968 (+) Transcript_126:113-3016(+)
MRFIPETNEFFDDCDIKQEEFASISNQTAILLMDFQNEFGAKGGKLHKTVSEVMDETAGMLHKVVDLVKAARKMGSVIIYAPLGMNESELYLQQRGLLTKNSWNCEFMKELKPTADDFILEDRTDFNAFSGTNLHSIIKSNKIKHLFMMGFLTDVTVCETARAAPEILPDVLTYVISDGYETPSFINHDAVLGESIPKCAIVLTCAQAKLQMSLYSTKEKLGDDWLLIEKVFAAAGADQDETLDIMNLISFLRYRVSSHQLFVILDEEVHKKNIEGQVSRGELHKIIFERKQRTTCSEKIPIFILIWFLPFFYSFSTRLPFIFIALEVQSKERGGELWQVGVILGTYQACRAIANLLIVAFGGKNPFKRLEIIMVSLGLFGWLTMAFYTSTSVWSLFALCGVGLSETILNLQRSVIIETEKESPAGLVDNTIVASRLGLQYAAVSTGSATAYIVGGIAFTWGGFKLTCWLGVISHVGQIIGTLIYLCLSRIDKKKSRKQDLDGHDLFNYTIYQLQAALIISSHADDIARGASDVLASEPQGYTIAAKKAKDNIILTRSLRDMFNRIFTKNEDSKISMEIELNEMKSSHMDGLKSLREDKLADLFPVDTSVVANILVYLMKTRGEKTLNENEFISYWGPRVYLSIFEEAQESTVDTVWPYMKVVVATQAVMALCIGTFLSTALLYYTNRFGMEADSVGVLLGIGELLGMVFILLRRLLAYFLRKISLHKKLSSCAFGAIFSRPLHVPLVLIILSIATMGFTIPHMITAIAFQMLMSSMNDLSVSLLVELTGSSLPADRFKYYHGLGQWLRRLGNTFTGVFGPILFSFNMSFPFLLFGFINFVWTFLVWRLMYLHAKKVELSNNNNDKVNKKKSGGQCFCVSEPFEPFIATMKTPWHVLERQYYSLNKNRIYKALNPSQIAQPDIASLNQCILQMGAALKVERTKRRALEERFYEYICQKQELGDTGMI